MNKKAPVFKLMIMINVTSRSMVYITRSSAQCMLLSVIANFKLFIGVNLDIDPTMPCMSKVSNKNYSSFMKYEIYPSFHG